MSDLAPILKWAGGKRQLLPEIMPLIPNNINRYYEPFLGAGAVLLELRPQKAIVNDTNTELINVYGVIKEHPKELIALLEKHEKKHSKDYYYQIRDIDRNAAKYNRMNNIQKAARTIYLNRTCYNGLYRVNHKGFFNTPVGRNSTITITNRGAIEAMSEYLNHSQIRFLNTDYRQAVRWIRDTDFVFLDPPYYPTNRDYFTRYDHSPFGVKEQIELKKLCDRLNSRNIRFLQTNSNCQEIYQLYGAYNIREVDVRRCINANADGRTGTEVIITNY